ncbi:MAG: Gfo/Idh/MocA family oxidoreductase [bacterium]|nr:Gfo/Idh/MocA family oxidoreductase [bacterium]
MKKRKSGLSRRTFLGTAAAAVGVPAIIPASARGADGHVAPSERTTMAVVGLGGQGTRDMHDFLRMRDVQMVALCDVDQGSTRYENEWLRGLAPAQEAVGKHYADRDGAENSVPDGYADFRDVLARDDIDAVSIGTPDHWHALIAVAAAKAGKDVYCQKPLARTIPEGRAIVEAVRENDSVFQCGSQRRSEQACRKTCEQVRNGAVGRLKRVDVLLPGGHHNPGYAMGDDPMPVPEGFDYNAWLGPAPEAAYTHKRCHFTFRWNLDYSGGQVTDWGAHFIDMAHWGMGTEGTGPVEISGEGEWPDPKALWNTATAFHFTLTYANGVVVDVRSGGHQVTFIGDEGRVNLGGKVERDDGQEFDGERKVKLYRSVHQHRNFVECVKSREQTSTPVDVAHHSIAPSHLANIAMLTGRTIKWDPDKEQILNDAEANAMLSYPHRAPWTLTG